MNVPSPASVPHPRQSERTFKRSQVSSGSFGRSQGGRHLAGVGQAQTKDEQTRRDETRRRQKSSTPHRHRHRTLGCCKKNISHLESNPHPSFLAFTLLLLSPCQSLSSARTQIELEASRAVVNALPSQHIPFLPFSVSLHSDLLPRRCVFASTAVQLQRPRISKAIIAPHRQSDIRQCLLDVRMLTRTRASSRRTNCAEGGKRHR